MEQVALDLLPREHQMVCQNTLLAEKYLEFNRRPNFSFDFSLDFFTAKVAVFRASVWRDCNSDDDLSCNKALSASFFVRSSKKI